MTDLENLSLALSKAWDDIIIRADVNAGNSQRILSGVFVMRSIEALMEHGFLLPEVSLMSGDASDLHILTVEYRLGKTRNGFSKSYLSSKAGQWKVMLIFKIS